jgi:hypothetical protein
MPTIKLNAAGKVITKNGKPSCTCCCVCDFTIYAELVYDEYFEVLANKATFYIVNNSTCPLEVTSLIYTGSLDHVSVTPALSQTAAGTSTLVLAVEEMGIDIQGLNVTAQTSCGEFTFDIPYGT